MANFTLYGLACPDVDTEEESEAQNFGNETQSSDKDSGIALRTHEDSTYAIDLFSVSAPFGCLMEFELMEGSSVNSQTYIKIDSTTVQPLNLVIENTTNEHYHGGVPQTFKIRAKIIDTTVTEDLSFTVLLYPNCANDKVTLTNVQTLASKTVRVESGSETLTFDKPKFDQTYDDDACHFPQEYYSLQQMYHPGPDAAFMPEPFDFTVNVHFTPQLFRIPPSSLANSILLPNSSECL